MSFTLQVVGVFFTATIEVPGKTTILLSDLMDAFTAEAASGRLKTTKGTPVSLFQYTDNGNSLGSVNIKYEEDFESRVQGRKYKAGEYFLSEDLVAQPAYSVWQYYIYDADKKQQNFGSGTASFKVATVPENGTAVWRLVNVLADRNSPPLVARVALGATPNPLAT